MFGERPRSAVRSSRYHWQDRTTDAGRSSFRIVSCNPPTDETAILD
jgi:hypothetical protein